MDDPFFIFRSLSPDRTKKLAEGLSSHLSARDVILLDGPIGSGKTHFSRALIQARLAAEGAPVEDVPSPTFTLVQRYDAGPVEILHADLYRLTHPYEVEELGLFDAFESDICLIEWPDRLADLAPKDALILRFKQGPQDDARLLELSGNETWQTRLRPILEKLEDV